MQKVCKGESQIAQLAEDVWGREEMRRRPDLLAQILGDEAGLLPMGPHRLAKHR